MTRDDIIRMTREAGGFDATPEFLERFAALVAAAEREKVARWQIGSGYTTGHGETIEDLLVELEWQVRESEREACAKVCEEKQEYSMPIACPDGISGCLVAHYVPARRDKTGSECAAAIRARKD